MEMKTVLQNNTSQSTVVNKSPLLAVMLIGTFVAVLNETLLNVALIQIMNSLNVTASTAQWLTTGYLLVIGILIPSSAFLIQRFTTRQLFLTAMSLFTFGTFLAGISSNFSMLLTSRLIQATGTGIILPLLTTVILAIIPPEKRGSAMGKLGFVILCAPALGPVMSGLIVEHFSWRMLFISIFPIAIFSLIFSAIVLKNVTEQTKPKIDLLSIFLSTIGFGGIVLGFSMAGEGHGGWLSTKVLISIIMGFIGIFLFIWRQMKLKDPMLNLIAFKNPLFSFSVVIIMIVMMAMFSAMLLLPIFLQNAVGISPFETGLLLLPGGIIMGVMSPVTGRLFDRFGAKWLAVIGLCIMTVILILFSQITLTTSFSYMMFLHSILMFGVSLLMMPVMTMGLNQLEPHLHSHGTAITNTLQQVAGAVGTALLITVMSNGAERYLTQKSADTSENTKALALTAGINDAFTLAATLIIGALVLSLFLKQTNQKYSESRLH
ncbi:MDR family MFS transporter [Peribacillus frigoritolerans]|uniref:MDR family MFS transporter n=1 Tax=Peribacillus frigoritolerans TaxID=450367 RepID=UPI00387141CB